MEIIGIHLIILLLQINSETDFVARNENFMNLTVLAAERALQSDQGRKLVHPILLCLNLQGNKPFEERYKPITDEPCRQRTRPCFGRPRTGSSSPK